MPNYNHSYFHAKKIFWCWFKGEENAPELYRACFNSLKKNINDYEIILITEDNLSQYVQFPPYILKKFKANIISPTHFSDLLRLELLIKYSGTWIDASVLLTKFDDIFFKSNFFFFQSFNNKNVAGSSWFLTSEKEHPILKTTRDLLYEYWRKNDNQYNYFIFHFFFKLSCNKYYEDLKKVPEFSNEPVHILQTKLLTKFSEIEYKTILNNASIHKLTNRIPSKEEKGLFYHHILNDYPDLRNMNLSYI